MYLRLQPILPTNRKDDEGLDKHVKHALALSLMLSLQGRLNHQSRKLLLPPCHLILFFWFSYFPQSIFRVYYYHNPQKGR